MDFSEHQVEKAVNFLATSPKALERAFGANLLVEERVADNRRLFYEKEVCPVPVDHLEGRHNRYVKNHINVKRGTPATFLPGNDWAALTPPDPNQDLIRVENIQSAVEGYFDGGHTEFSGQFEIYEKKLAGHEDAERRLVTFINEWNTYRDLRPMFAAFLDGLRIEVAASDWANQLRSRLGLGHLTASPTAPLTVAMMRYKVEDVLAKYTEQEHDQVFVAPTVTDATLNPYFFPTPRPTMLLNAVLGSAVHLSGQASKLVSETLHRHIPYKLSHMIGVEILTAPIPGGKLWEIRNLHLNLLRIGTGRSNFGVEMTADSD